MKNYHDKVISLSDRRLQKAGSGCEATQAQPQAQAEAATISEDERLVLMLARECHDLDDIVSVLRTLSHNAVRLGDIKTDPMVLADWAKKFRGLSPGNGPPSA